MGFMPESKRALPTITSSMKAVFVSMGKGLLGFMRVYIFLFAAIAVSGLVYAISLPYPSLTVFLSASANTPWGIVTSIFTHSSFDHYANNMYGLTVLIAIFVFANCSLLGQKKVKVENFLIVTALIAAVSANVLWISVKSSPSVGASGLLYAVNGIVLGFALYNGLQFLDLKRFKTQRVLVMTMVFVNTILAAALLAQVLLNPELFLNVGAGVNVIAHGVSFLIGMFAAFFWCLIKKVSLLE
jgi:membrane associated rhomboid family serine protease